MFHYRKGNTLHKELICSMDLMIPLQKTSSIPIYEQLYNGIKTAILKGQLHKQTKLPSKRQLAEFLSISQTTVELAYGQLLAEGYIRSEARVGYFVEDILELPYIEQTTSSFELSDSMHNEIRYNFSPSLIDEQSFPFSTWRKYAKLAIDELHSHLLQTGHRQGEHALRVEIAHYLYHSRGIECQPEQIVVGSGTEHLLPMILRLFDEPTKLAIENPGYSAIPFSQLNDQHAFIPVDEDGLRVKELEKSDANIVYVTPSHQFPTGAILSASRRALLLKWATERSNRYIIEDDYDSEFRYVGKPIAALQSLDQNNKVIYLSTFTKSFMPSLRVAYFVLPKTLLKTYKERLSHYSSTVPRIDQHILASFMRDGHFSKHLNKMRKIYRKKHDKVIQIFSTYYPDVKITGEEAGMHLLIHIPSEIPEQELVNRATKQGIIISSISTYLFEEFERKQATFLVGFGGIPYDEIEDAIHALMTAFKVQAESGTV